MFLRFFCFLGRKYYCLTLSVWQKYITKTTKKEGKYVKMKKPQKNRKKFKKGIDKWDGMWYNSKAVARGTLKEERLER